MPTLVCLGLQVDEGVRCTKGLQVGGDIRVARSLHAGQGIAAGGSVEVGMHLQAGWGIKAAGEIRSAGAIRAGESLSAGGTIRAGAGYGVFAGLDVQVEARESSARVSAQEKPEGLMSGWWAGPFEPLSTRTSRLAA